MVLQVTYPANFALGQEGQLADGGTDRRTVTAVEETGLVDYFFGRAVERGTVDATFVTPAGTAANFLGITSKTHAVEIGELPLDPALEGIPATQPANVTTKGRVIVLPETAVAPGNAVFYRFQNAGAAPEGQGRFRADNDAASGDVVELAAGSGVAWVTSANAGEPAILEVNRPT
jgi:hypothetical protein